MISTLLASNSNKIIPVVVVIIASIRLGDRFWFVPGSSPTRRKFKKNDGTFSALSSIKIKKISAELLITFRILPYHLSEFIVKNIAAL